jgi:urease accessory protein
MTGDLVVLLHLCDSLFPLGSFAHSDGLEAASSRGDVQDGPALRGWMDSLLHATLRHSEGPVVARSWQHMGLGDAAALANLDAEASALRPSSTGREASRAMGARLLKTWSGLRPTPALLAMTQRLPSLSLPSAFGVVCAAADLGQHEAVSGFLYTRLASTVSAAMRLMPLGQHEAHSQLAACLGEVPALTAAIVADRAPLTAFAPAFDIASMRQQYGHSRLFRS